MTKHLIIFAKNPELGKTKTRIGKKLGDELALAVYYQLIKKAQEVTANVNAIKIVYYSSFIDKEDSWDNQVYKKRKQTNTDLGLRMANAIQDSFDEGAEKAILIGTDIYSLTPEIIEDAFSKLDKSEVVIGPAKDGGYYLIGMKISEPSIFNLKEWSHSKVLSDTISLIEKANLSWSPVKELNDIDEPEDLKGTDLEKLIKSKT